MLFNSGEFLIFFVAVTLLYFVLPGRCQNPWLLLCSYLFYACYNPFYLILLAAVTLITYLTGRWLGENGDAERSGRHRKIGLFLCCAVNLGLLGYFKYYDFFADTANRIFSLLHFSWQFSAQDVILPIGISFYMFQSIGYVVDVYRGDVSAEHNLVKYALFLSFFPQISSGPIARAPRLLKQFEEEHRFCFERVRSGFMVMLWGYFLKIVLADRIAVIVDAIYTNYELYNGWYLIVAALLFSLQIYGDFAGYSAIAIGAAEIMGFHLDENFRTPYLAHSVAGFWRGWHMSLTGWFRDYLYIPLGGNRRGKLRKYCNIMIVFLLSGLWHGANWNFVVWGGINGLLQIAGDLLKPIRNKIVRILRLNRSSFGHRMLQVVTTYCLMSIAWVFFKIEWLRTGLQIVKSMLTAQNIWVLFDDSLLQLGVDWKNWMVMLLSIAVLLAVDCLNHRGIMVREVLRRQDLWFRWMALIGGILFILIFGIWGSGYDAAAFIYAQF